MDAVFPASACVQRFLLREAVGGSCCLSTFLTCHHMPVKHSTQVKILRMQKKGYWGDFVLEWIHGVQSTTLRKSLFCAFFCEGTWRGRADDPFISISILFSLCLSKALRERGSPLGTSSLHKPACGTNTPLLKRNSFQTSFTSHATDNGILLITWLCS